MSEPKQGNPPTAQGVPQLIGMLPPSGRINRMTPIAKGRLEPPARPVVVGEKMNRAQIIKHRIKNFGKDPYTVTDTTRLPDKVFAGRVELPPEDLRKVYTGEVNPFV